MIIWLIGMSGAGKSTIGVELTERLRAQHKNIVFLDGDALREVWGDQVGHGLEGRRKNAERIERLCALLDAQGIHAVVAVLSIFPEYRKRNREKFSRYFEIFLDVPLEVLQARDPKGIYAKRSRGEIDNVVGIDIPFPPPTDSDLTISGDDISRKPGELVDRIMAALPKFAD